MNTHERPAALQLFLTKLESINGEPARHSGGTSYQTRCPAHDDATPSLSSGWGDKNKVVFHCQAGCEETAVLEALGLKWKDLESKHVIDSVYSYENEQGEVVMEVVRFVPKGFSQRRPDPTNPKKKIWNIKGVVPVPYRLPELLEALDNGDDVYITEGEKDVEAMLLAYEDVAATCNHGGAEKWTDAHSEHFLGSESSIFVVADRDTAGYKHALAVRASLKSVAGITAQIVRSAVGKDAADHCRDFGLDHFVTTTPRELREEIAAEEGVKKAVSSGAHSSGNTAHSSGITELVLRPASSISSRLQKFLWDKRIPLGTITLFGGRGGVGKSSFAIWLAVEAQHGRLPGDLLNEPTSVLYVSVEDNWETQMKPRLAAAGAKMDTFIQVSIGYTEDEVSGERIPSLPDDGPRIREAIEKTGAKLVIIDPITSTMEGDDHKRDVVRAVLDPLAQIASETDAVIIGIMHFNKGAGNASDKLSGSHAYRDAARAVMLFAKDEDDGVVVMSQDKGNYAEFGDMSLAYKLVDTPVQLDDGNVARVASVHIVGETNTSVSQIINRVPGDDDGVIGWLTGYMSECGGRTPAEEALRAGSAAGYSKYQLARARKRCRPQVESKKTGMNGGWEWVSEESAHPEERCGISQESALVLPATFTHSSEARSFQRVKDPATRDSAYPRRRTVPLTLTGKTTQKEKTNVQSR